MLGDLLGLFVKPRFVLWGFLGFGMRHCLVGMMRDSIVRLVRFSLVRVTADHRFVSLAQKAKQSQNRAACYCASNQLLSSPDSSAAQPQVFSALLC